MIGGERNSENTVISSYLQVITAKLNNAERPDKEECYESIFKRNKKYCCSLCQIKMWQAQIQLSYKRT